MAHREFLDARGIAWQAWEVIPSTAERRRAERERRFGTRDQRDRRLHPELRVRMQEELTNGWLVFECATEKRRLYPVPAGWSSLSDIELDALAATAEAADRLPPRASP
jgi:hypothetical protein